MKYVFLFQISIQPVVKIVEFKIYSWETCKRFKFRAYTVDCDPSAARIIALYIARFVGTVDFRTRFCFTFFADFAIVDNTVAALSVNFSGWFRVCI